MLGDSASFRELERLARRQLKPVTASQKKLIDASLSRDVSASSDPVSLLFQHSTLCNTFLPYRNPGEACREWTRRNGNTLLELNAGKYYDPSKGVFVPVGLPFGPMARIVLLYVNQRAVQTKSPVVDVRSSLSAFVSRVLQLDSGGKTIKAVKLQLLLLSACQIRIGYLGADGGAETVNPVGIMQGFHTDMWAPREAKESLPWPGQVTLSDAYWKTLKDHSVPLEEQHIRALKHSSMAMDVYVWLAHRLHRIPDGKPCLVTWPLLQDQFGAGIGRLTNFRMFFRVALRQVLTLYREAKIEDTAGGLVLRKSPPIIKPRLSVVAGI